MVSVPSLSEAYQYVKSKISPPQQQQAVSGGVLVEQPSQIEYNYPEPDKEVWEKHRQAIAEKQYQDQYSKLNEAQKQVIDYTQAIQEQQQQIQQQINPIQQVWIPPKPGAYGLGGHFVYKDSQGNVIGEEMNVLQASTEPKPLTFKAKEGYNILNTDIRESITEPIYKTLGKAGLDISNQETATKVASYTPQIQLLKLVSPSAAEKASKVYGGFVSGINRDIREQPLKQAVIYYITRGVGMGTKFFLGQASRVPWMVKGIQVVPATAKVGIKGTEAFLVSKYAIGTAKAYKEAETPEAKAGILGVTLKDIYVGSLGYRAGSKDYDVLASKVKTSGRVSQSTPQGEYPKAQPSKQLGMFERNVVPELSSKPGAYHTTSEQFWIKTKIIEPRSGASELPGLYASTQVSTPFSRIPGSGGTTSFLSRIIPTKAGLIKWLNPVGDPAIAYLVPKGFRKVQVGWSKTPTFKGQASVRGKYAVFKNKAVPGIADVPGMKTEIETIFRPDTGPYTFVSGKTYTTIKGVRVPVDVFEYGGKVTGKTVAGGKTGPTLLGGKSSYGYPVESSSVSISGIIPSTLMKSSFIKSKSPTSFLSSIPKSKTSSIIPRTSRESYVSRTSSTKTSITPSSSIVSTSYVPRPSSRVYPRPTPRPNNKKPKDNVFVAKKSKGKSKLGYYVVTKKMKNPFLITPRPLTKGQALAVGTAYTRKTSRASFKLVPTTREPISIAIRPMKETEVYSLGFRAPIKKGRTQPSTNIFIQKLNTRMGRRSEQQDISSYRKRKGLW